MSERVRYPKPCPGKLGAQEDEERGENPLKFETQNAQNPQKEEGELNKWLKP